MTRKPARASLRSQTASIDKVLLFTVLALALFGIVMVGNASLAEAERNFGDKFFYLRQQAMSAVLGIGALLFFSFFPHERLKSLAAPIFWVNIILLGLVLVPKIGIEALGARRWLGVGQFVLQPAEFIKLSLALYLAKILSEKKDLLPFLLLSGLAVGLVVLEPDLGTALLVAGLSGILYFASGAPFYYFFLLVPAAFAATALLILISPYRKQRLLTFLNPATDPLGASYHMRQILIALGGGGLFGVGLGQSRQKFFFLPESQTDSIFAIIGEELGFFGAGVVIIAFILITYRGFLIAAGVQDNFSKLLAVGITSFISLQAFINLGAMVALFPLTGIPLPFISYGGSSLVTSLSGVGMLLNISKRKRQK